VTKHTNPPKEKEKKTPKKDFLKNFHVYKVPSKYIGKFEFSL